MSLRLVERVHADRGRGWDNGSRISWEQDIVPLVDAYNALRAENLNLRERLEVRTQHGHNLRTMLESATETERAAVVAFVRGARLDELADAIERGEHRREEEK